MLPLLVGRVDGRRSCSVCMVLCPTWNATVHLRCGGPRRCVVLHRARAKLSPVVQTVPGESLLVVHFGCKAPGAVACGATLTHGQPMRPAVFYIVFITINSATGMHVWMGVHDRSASQTCHTEYSTTTRAPTPADHNEQ